jgi:hypothetical protein
LRRYNLASRTSGLARYNVVEGIQQMGEMFVASRATLRLQSALSTHPLGWELRLETAGQLVRSQVCKHEADVFKTAGTWKAEAESKGGR